ncbi:MAG: protein-L-isoaspartate(D-aspartate) O-methyltransferase [Anaerolineales bacterium]|jgi:protein-L-isoaspartate(D-aspartate) O-methyltransferase
MTKIPKGERQDERLQMVRHQIENRDIDDELVLEAMRRIPRELFIPPDIRAHAYADSALPIAEGQTISQPYIVALMTQALEPSPADRVLEIGTGSGYAAAILGLIVREVYSLERHAALAEKADELLQQIGICNVHVIHADGTNGWPEASPYDGIVVTAGAPEVPEPLVEQLAVGGHLVLPVGKHTTSQHLMQLTKTPDGSLEQDDLGAVRFVPLVGKHGWDAE